MSSAPRALGAVPATRDGTMRSLGLFRDVLCILGGAGARTRSQYQVEWIGEIVPLPVFVLARVTRTADWVLTT